MRAIMMVLKHYDIFKYGNFMVEWELPWLHKLGQKQAYYWQNIHMLLIFPLHNNHKVAFSL